MRVKDARPWYREPWPWLLMIAPGAALIGGVITAVIAFNTSDGLVADDYYKQGLMINRALEKSANAARLGLAARMSMSEGRVRLGLPTGLSTVEHLRLTLAHPTRAGRDQSIAMVRASDGFYEGVLGPVESAHWRLQLEDDTGKWRLSSSWNGRSAEAVFAP